MTQESSDKDETATPETDAEVRWVFTDETFPLGNADKTPYEAVPRHVAESLERRLRAAERTPLPECGALPAHVLQAINVGDDGKGMLGGIEVTGEIHDFGMYIARLAFDAGARVRSTTGHWVFAAAEAHRPLVDKISDVYCLRADGPDHCREMLDKIRDAGFSPTKACRWLGWIQGVLCAHDIASLDELKAINKAASEAFVSAKGTLP